jgi:hypothetical protein
MIDAKARQLYNQRDFINLFRYLDPMWIVSILQILDDLFDCGFIPNPDRYEPELRKAGVFVERMQVAMAAVLHKHGHSITWGKFWELQQFRLTKLPPQQHREIREYWIAGPMPGLAGPGDQAAPVIGNSGDWFVTAFGGTTTSVVLTAGFTALTGSITFTRADGARYSNAIGIVGPSVGASITPNISKIPGFGQLAQRFPAFTQLIAPESAGLSNALLKWLTSSPSLVAKALFASPALMRAIPIIQELVKGASIGPASLPSPAIGLVCANNQRTLQVGDFAGACVMFFVSGTVAVGGAGIYVLAFGLDKWWNPISDPKLDKAKGFALISAASISIQIPSLATGATLAWGEIV